MIILKHPRPIQFNSSDYKAYKSLVAQTNVKPFPNRAGNAVILGERVEEVESEDTDDIDTASIGYIGDSGILPPGSSIPLPVHTRSYGKAKKTKDRETFL